MTDQEQMDEAQIDALFERLDGDSDFAKALDADPFAALRGAGFDTLADAAEQERQRIGELVDRIYDNDEFRRAVEQDPYGELLDWGLPEVAIEPVLLAAGAPDEVVGLATADFEGHVSMKKPATIAALAAVVGALAFAETGSAASPAQAAPQVSPAQASAQVSQPARASAQVSRIATSAQVRPGTTAAQVRPGTAKAQFRPGQVRWQGLQLQRMAAQGNYAAIMRALR